MGSRGQRRLRPRAKTAGNADHGYGSDPRGVDEVDVGDAAAADATEAVAPKTPVCDIVLVTEDGPEPIRNVTVAVPALRGLVETAGLAVHSPPPEYGFRALEGAKASDNENV